MFFEDIVKLHRDEAYQEGYDDAYEEAYEESHIETAQNFLAMGILPEQISKGTGLPLEKVMELKEKLAVKS